MHAFGRRFLSVSLVLLALLAQTSHSADTQDMPDKPVLTVTGAINTTNSDDRFVFSMAMLEQLPQYSFTTATPWYPEAHKFSGPLLRDILSRVGADGETLTAIALNDYKVTIPLADSTEFNMIVALFRDDKKMPIRDKGPLFILYPFDNDSETQSQIYYDRSIWQLKALHIE
jgi:hypothetical protein